jgi:hypothetical protein
MTFNKLEYDAWLAEVRKNNKARREQLQASPSRPQPAAPDRMTAEEVMRCYNKFVLGEEDADEWESDEDDKVRKKKKKQDEQPDDEQPDDEDDTDPTARAIMAAYNKAIGKE